jgi:hypothetical protein
VESLHGQLLPRNVKWSSNDGSLPDQCFAIGCHHVHDEFEVMIGRREHLACIT